MVTEYKDAIPVTETRVIERPSGEAAIVQNNYFGGGELAIADKPKPAPAPLIPESALIMVTLGALLCIPLYIGHQTFLELQGQWEKDRAYDEMVKAELAIEANAAEYKRSVETFKTAQLEAIDAGVEEVKTNAPSAVDLGLCP